MNEKKILKLMKDRGMNTTRLSELSGVPVSTVNKIVYGITREPSVNAVRDIAHALGYTLDELLDEDCELELSAGQNAHTIAAHHDGNEWSEIEREELESFKRYLRSKRNTK